MGNEKKVRLAFYFTLLGIVSAAIIYNDFSYIQNRSILAAIETLRILLLLIVARAILVYFSEKRVARFDFWAKYCIIAVFAFDILIAFTRPRDASGGFFFSIGLLLLGYFLPLESKKFRNYAALAYSAVLAALLLFIKTAHLPTELIILVMLAGINAIGIVLPTLMVPLAKTATVMTRPEEAPEIPEHEGEHERADIDYRSQLEAKIEALPLTKREKEVACHILRGESRSEIATELYLSEETIKKHTANIYEKLEISSHSELFRAVLG